MPARMLAWRGLDAWRAEVAEVDLAEDRLSARGVQIGALPSPYRLEYELDTVDGVRHPTAAGASSRGGVATADRSDA